MNNRDYKNFSIGEIYHVYNRGVGKMDIFLDTEDYSIFIARLRENLFPESSTSQKHSERRKLLPPNSFDLLCYCLMPNHFHFLIQQITELPVTQLISKICTSYSKYFNKKYDRIGVVFQDRFKAVRVSNNKQLLWTSFYIHNNPKKALIVDDLSKYEWGSYLDYSESRNGTLCKKEIILGQYNSPTEYLKMFKYKSKEIENNLISHMDLLLDFE